MPSLRAVLRAAGAATLVLAAACADSTSTRVQPVPDAPAPLRLVCRADVAKGTVECAEPGTDGVRADRILGQGTGVKLTSGNIAVFADSFTFDMTVTNQFEFPIGTTDGVNPDPNGIRVFFVDGIHTTGGTGSVTVANADGVDAFTAAGQAYFAYHGVLQPGATTAARRWKLRFDPGVTTFSFGLYVSTPVPPGGGYVALRIIDPRPNQVFSDSVYVNVRLDSASASIQSVTAYVADRSVVLTPLAPGVVSGKLSVAGLPFGAHQLRVHAVTVRADTGNAYVTIIKDAPPTLTVTAPRVGYVATPSLRIDADCADDNPAGCTSITASIGDSVLASGTGGIHTDVSLASRNETNPSIRIQALDSGGHTLLATVSVYVQSAPALTVADSAGAVAMDLDSTRLLFADAANTVWVQGRPGGARTLVQASTFTNVQGTLYSLGAVFMRKANGHVYDWRSGTVVDVSGGASDLVAKGSWATWYNASVGAGRRDLLAGTTEFVGGTVHPDVAANGGWVYDSGTGRVYSQPTTFASRVLVDSVGSQSPLTDGNRVVYQAGWLRMWDGTTSTVLTTSPGGSTPHTHYEINAGWIAYTIADGAGATQIRVRAPNGTDTQVTSTLAGNLIRALGADGTLVFARSGVQYALPAPYTAAPTRLGKDWFIARFRGPELQLFLGNTAFAPSY
jgi:hypothetical protein